MQKRFPVRHSMVFPHGVGIRPTAEGEPAVQPVQDFEAPKRDDGSRPQVVDRESGLPVWQVTVMDFDPEAGKKDMVVTVKFLSKVQPVPPANTSGMPFTPVEFVGLTALAWAEYSGNKNKEGKDQVRIAWSFRAEEMVEPGAAKKPDHAAGSSQGGEGGRGKAAA